ncbi:MAG: T9SS type A sorting domain-containing protein [Bacteroidetes bacterium]|nr:T9SS type A sorting domain-containing protein [Bacteroidota bacterium]
MKYLYTILALISFQLASNAQSITANEFPAVDDTLIMWPVSDTSGIADPSSGTGQTWDYSTIKLDKSKSPNYRFVQPSKATNGSKFSSSNIAAIEPGQPAITTFYNRTSNLVEVVGVNTAIGTALVYSDKETWLKYPVNYNGSSNDTYGGSASGFGGSTTTRLGDVTTKGIGTGTLILPYKKYNDAMLIEITTTYIDSIKSIIGSVGTSTTETRYMWYVSGTRGWVFEIKNSNTQGGIGSGLATKTVYMKQAMDSTGVGINEPTSIKSMVFYPNPVNSEINIQFDLLKPENILIHISDLSGAILYTENRNSKSAGLQQLTLNSNSLTSGVYILSINNQKYKFIKI